jgi:peptidoglycan/xylan/chitin deacetylase (PgdA/CDA1 family)
MHRLARFRSGRVAVIASAIAAIWATPASAETVVSLTFDDQNLNQLAAKPILAEHGMQGTFYIITGRVGRPPTPTSVGTLSWDQIASFQADGHEIGGHTVTHAHLPALPPAQQQSEICNARQELLARGFPQVSFAYPFGEHDATSEALVEQCGYLSGRNVSGLQQEEGEPDAETIPPQDRWVIRTRGSIDVNDMLPEIQDWIMDAEGVDATNGTADAWIPLVFHHICDPPDPACADPQRVNNQYITSSDFDELLDWIQARESLGTRVKTVAGVIGPDTQVLASQAQIAFELRSIRAQGKGKARLVFVVNGPGGLEAVDRSVAGASSAAAKKRNGRIRPVSKFVPQAGPVTLVIVPSKAGMRILKRKGKLKVPVQVTFTPIGGSPTSQTVKVKLRLTRR